MSTQSAPLARISDALSSLDSDIEEARWGDALHGVQNLQQSLKALIDDDPTHAEPEFLRVRAELQRLQDLSQAKRSLLSKEIRQLGQGRKAVRGYA